MQGSRRTQFPPAALDWMVAARGCRLLNLGGSPALPRLFANEGHRVFAVDKDLERVEALHEDPRLVVVAAQAESLPFEPCQFDTVTAHQVFHRFAPGLVLSEMARVLRPGGCASISYLVRDDSVPWVRRLVALLRQVDDKAMRGDYGTDSIAALTDSKYFPQVETRDFRVWQPVTRAGLLAMVKAQPAVAALDEDLRQLVLDDVRALYEASAPGADSLRLPYQLRIWRAWVDHQELTAPIELAEDGLVIPL